MHCSYFSSGGSMRKETRIEKHFVYALSAILFLLGILLIVISYFISSSLISSIVRTIGATFCPSGVVAFVFEYYIQEKWAQDLKKSLESDITVVSGKLGIKRIYTNRAEWDKERLNQYHKAKEVRYLAVSPNLSPPYNDEKMIEKILELLQGGTSFYFLVCSSENPFATQYYGYRPTDSSVEDFKKGMEVGIERLKEIKNKNKGPGKIEIRIYNTSPGGYMQIIDNKIFFEPYLYGSTGQKPFMFELEEGEPFNIFYTHFQKIWENATPIDEFLEMRKK